MIYTITAYEDDEYPENPVRSLSGLTYTGALEFLKDTSAEELDRARKKLKDELMSPCGTIIPIRTYEEGYREGVKDALALRGEK